ncbi:alanine racemase [Velocimicrobium porci]|uniref:Alanine racemase n=1 Tax=Velocimicrobium porci TaxID=2606634 RepID=A0A6L5XWP7_9FIRM|nr:alanine racemase [Velocimicrobium porci]MSS62453.1 alanine racemase [Velocimicrobium porci]
MKEYYRVVAEVNLDAICDNIRNTKKIIKDGTKLMAIVKADGYGHGAVPVAKALNSLVDAYGVAIVEEGIELRNAGIKKPILVLGCVPAMQYHCLAEYDIMPAVTTYDMAKAMSEEAKKQGKTLRIHIKLDTGMGRIGFLPNEESVEEIKKISELSNIEIDGCFSHFAKADEKDKEFANEQFSRYMKMINRLKEAGIFVPTRHISNSAGIMDLPIANLDMVRSGISTYGMYPSEEVNKERLPLKAAMTIYSYITFVKELEEGCSIGYGGTFITKRKTKVATVPVGYGDGYKRALSNQGHVLIQGKRAPIIGRVCMDQFMIDVTDFDEVKAGDKVILVGTDGNETISMEEIGKMTCSFNYEVACDIGKRIPRVYIYQGKVAGTCDYYNTDSEAFDLNF